MVRVNAKTFPHFGVVSDKCFEIFLTCLKPRPQVEYSPAGMPFWMAFSINLEYISMGRRTLQMLVASPSRAHFLLCCSKQGIFGRF